MKRLVSGAAAAGIALVGLSSATSAGAHEAGAGRPSDAPQGEVSLLVEGHIRSACHLPALDDVQLGNLEASSRRVRLAFPLSCNLPFELEIRSGGAILHETTPHGEGGFAGSLGYALDFSLPLAGPDGNRLLHRRLSSAQLAGSGAVISSGEAISNGDGALTLTVEPVGDGRLLAGAYGDTIVMVLRTGL